jgi:hypothetical protein
MAKFKTKPFIIEALLFTGENEDEIKKMCGADFWLLDPINHDQIDEGIIAEVFDKLHSTWVGVKAGQWIIKGQKGEFYPCDPDIFDAKYEDIDTTRENIGEKMRQIAMEPVDEIPVTLQKFEGLMTPNEVRNNLSIKRWDDDGGK